MDMENHRSKTYYSRQITDLQPKKNSMILNSREITHFHFKKRRLVLTCFGFSLFLLAETSFPALENNLSDGTEDLGIHKYFTNPPLGDR